jgi:hypothetical protein
MIVVFLSFIALLLWGNKSTDLSQFKLTYNFTTLTLSRFNTFARPTIGVLSVCIFVSLVSIGVLGSQNTFRNLLPVAIWVIWWVGFVYFTALFVNIWNLVNPWAFCFRVTEHIIGKEIKLASYPSWLQFWPAALFLFAFLWIELIWPNKETPENLSILIIFYSFVTWVGMTIYGLNSWLKYAEVFTVFFSLMGKFAPVQFSGDRKSVSLQPYALGLFNRAQPSMSMVLVIIILLAGLSFDGFMTTDVWLKFQTYILGVDSFNFTFQLLYRYFGSLQLVLETAGLVLAIILFFGVYTLACAATKILLERSNSIGKSQLSLESVIRHFVLTLLPIAIGYHVAHYLSYLLIAGQLAIPLLSDPYNLGWDLLGTNGYRINIGIINAKTAWNVTLVSIITGHVLSMFLSHRQTLELATTNNRSLIQVPMVGLMILYTGISLWILAQPIVEN